MYAMHDDVEDNAAIETKSNNVANTVRRRRRLDDNGKDGDNNSCQAVS
jgi:hypothetical protein